MISQSCFGERLSKIDGSDAQEKPRFLSCRRKGYFCFPSEKNKAKAGKSTVLESEKLLEKEELAKIEASGIPEPVSKTLQHQLSEEFELAQRDGIAACIVCDEFQVLRKTTYLNVGELNSTFLDVLRAPNCNSKHPLHPDLVHEYSIVKWFPKQHYLERLLLSPRGIVCRYEDCSVLQVSHAHCTCLPRLAICQRCYRRLFQKKSLPALAIANGNWPGRLSSHIRDMSYGSRTLITPVQCHGMISCFSSYRSTECGHQLRGRMYSTRLDTAVVNNKLPIAPKDVPVRVVVLSPYASDQHALYRCQLAKTKRKLIIERDKIEGAIEFMENVGNKYFNHVQVNEAVLRSLPFSDVSSDMFLIDEDPISASHGQDILCDGGPCLTTSNADVGTHVLISSVM